MPRRACPVTTALAALAVKTVLIDIVRGLALTVGAARRALPQGWGGAATRK